MAEAEVYQWRDGPPGVRYPGESHPNRTCTNLETHTSHQGPTTQHTGRGRHQQRAPNTTTLGPQPLHRKGTKTTISGTSLIQLNKTLDHTDQYAARKYDTVNVINTNKTDYWWGKAAPYGKISN